jgi:unsaturated rhamnogalacturonyl hydrolase
MKKKACIVAFAIASMFCSTVSFADEFAPDSIKSIMRKVAKYSFKEWGGGTAAGLDRDWSRGTIMTGIMGVYRTTGEKQWLDSVDNWGTKWAWTWGGGGGDNFCAIQTFCERYIVEPTAANAPKYQPSKTALDGILNQPVNHLYGWQDAVYMGLPDFSMMGFILNSARYYDSLNSMFRGAEKDFQDPVYKLWYWNTQPAFKTTPKGYPKFWGPGNAWVLGGLVRALKYMPKDSKYRAAWEATFKTFCDTLRVKQQSDGFWRTSLYEPTEFPNPESSCTSFFIYAMSLGVSWKVLDSAVYNPVIRKGWSALVKVVNADGKVGYGQPWSNAPGNPTLGNEIPEGHGAFLLAGEGVYLNVTKATEAGRLTIAKSSPAVGRAHRIVALTKSSPAISIPSGATGVEIFSLQGKRVWAGMVGASKSFTVPDKVSSGGVLYLSFTGAKN